LAAPPLCPYTTLFRSDFIIGNRSYGWFDDAAEPAVRVLTSATDTLDEGGRLDLRIPLEASAGRAAQASLVATVTDANRQTVSAADRKSTRLNSSHVKI